MGFTDPPKDKVAVEEDKLFLDKGVQYQISSFGDPPTDSMKQLAKGVADSFIELCAKFSVSRPRKALESDLHMQIKPSDFMRRNMAATAPSAFYMKAWAVTSLKHLRE